MNIWIYKYINIIWIYKHKYINKYKNFLIGSIYIKLFSIRVYYILAKKYIFCKKCWDNFSKILSAKWDIDAAITCFIFLKFR